MIDAVVESAPAGPSFRGVAGGLIEESRVLGYRTAAVEYEEAVRLELILIQGYLKSEDPKQQVAGLKAMRNVREHQCRLMAVEFRYMQSGIETHTAGLLGSQRVHDERPLGPTPEEVNGLVDDMLSKMKPGDASTST